MADVDAGHLLAGHVERERVGLIHPLNLTETEQSDLVAFMESLCGDPILDEAPPLPEYGIWDIPLESGNR